MNSIKLDVIAIQLTSYFDKARFELFMVTYKNSVHLHFKVKFIEFLKRQFKIFLGCAKMLV